MSDERDDLTHPLVGKRLREKWLIERVIGRGGMATVFAATHRNGMRGAIKLLNAGLADTPEVRGRFVREGRAANRIDHPGVVKLLDDDVTEDGQLFLVMELLEGKSLRQRWDEAGRKLPVAEAVTIAIGVLDILDAAHRAGVVHRDVKPDNVFLVGGDAESGVKLLDFGIARMRDAKVDATQDGSLLGTPAFMSPEQALARWDDVDHRSDLFSLGATLRTILSGRLVHPATTVPELLIASATQHAKPTLSVLPDLSPEIGQIIDKSLAFDKRARWQHASEMRDALREARARLPAGRQAVRTQPLSAAALSPAHAPYTLIDPATAPPVGAGGTVDLAFSKTPTSKSLATLPPLLPPTVNEAPPSRLKPTPWRRRALLLAASALVPLAAIAIWQASNAPEEPPPPLEAAPTPPAPITSSEPVDDCGRLGGACCANEACSDKLDRCTGGVCRGGVRRLFGAGARACATHADGRVSCWGDDPLVGTPPTALPQRGPLLLPGVRDPDALVLGKSAALAIVEKRVIGWGKNTHGLLGQSVPPTADVSSAEAIDLKLDGATDLAIGQVHDDVAACAIVEGQLRCWGRVAGGVRDLKDSARVAVRNLDFFQRSGGVPFPLPPVRIGLGASDFACSILRDDLHGEVGCWGTSRPWQLLDREAANKELGISVAHPSPIPSLLATGSAGACYAVDRAIQCWGRVADCDDNLAQWRMLAAPGVVTDIAIGSGHHCAVLKGGELWCRGADGAAFGATKGNCELRRVPLPSPAVSVVAGSGFTCVLTQPGAAYCLGAPNGRFGCDAGTRGTDACRVSLTP